MDIFNKQIKLAESQDDIVNGIMSALAVSMKQYFPKIATVSDVEDNIDMPTAYKILELGAGIKLSPNQDEDEEADGKQSSKDISNAESNWESFDLAKLESEAFLLGIWKDYEELESSLSMPELIETISAKRESDYNDKKFMAAIQGIDIDKENKSNAWEEMKARVFSKGQTDNPNDIVAFQGANAQKAGFGIGMGLSYERID